MITPTALPVPSKDPRDLAFNAEKIDEAVTSDSLTYTDRLGRAHLSLAGAVDRIAAVNVRGAWAPSTSYALKDVVTVSGIAYICIVPHTSVATFAADAAAWAVYQGVLATDLANPTALLKGASMVAITPNDQNGGGASDVRQVILAGIGSGVPVLKSAYADSPTAVITGEEYLFSLGPRVLVNRNGTYAEISVLFSGDSTTFGVNATPYTIDYCFEREADLAGLSFFKSYNRGHSGEDTVDWGMTGGYAEQDIADFPGMGLYVARWGLNDGNFQATLGTAGALTQYETNLRLGLSKLRAFKDVGSLAIVLMTPNTTSEDPYRNERWHEKIQSIIRKAARDYQCVFIDTYQIWRDGRRQAVGMWLDNVGGAGIHPDAWLTMMIARKVSEVVFSPWKNFGHSELVNVPGGKGRKAYAAIPAEFPYGISYYRTDMSTSWPEQGVICTEKNADNVVLQTLIAVGGNARVYKRKASSITAWGEWNGRRSLNLSNGWATKAGFVGPIAYKDDSNVVTITAALDGSAKTSNQALTLPVGWRPLTNAVGDVRTQAGTHGALIVDSSGGVTVVQGGMPNFTDAHIDFSFEAYA